MPMIVANKRRIASVFEDYHLDAGAVVGTQRESRATAEIFGSAANIPILKLTTQKLAKNTCQVTGDEPR
jgi:hypothetical protein